MRRIVTIMLVTWSSLASAATYYVSSSAGSDGNNGTSAATPWQTIAHVNGQTFQPGDSILLKRGDVWNESLVAPSSGSSGNPIAFDAYGTGAPPNLTGYYAVPTTAWVLVTGNAWKAAVPATYTTVNFCLFGSIWGQKVAAGSSNLTAPGNFYLANGFLYVYSSGNPATFYNEAIVPMALSNVPVININGQSWLTLQHFLVNWFDQYGVYVQGASDHLVFANMEADSMIPQGTQPLGFYVDESAPGPGDIRIYNSEAHLNYDGFRFDGAATSITMVNDKAYANRDGALVDNTGVVTYSYCHFYASSLAVAGSTDVEWTTGDGPTAGPGNIAPDTEPAVQVYQRYPAEITLTVDDAGMTPGADTYYANTVLPIADAAGVPVGAAITVGYPLAQTLISEFQGWINAGRDVTAHSMSHTYYVNSDALDIQYTGSGTAASLSISGNTLTITVTGASDSVSYNLARGQPQGTMLGLAQALAATGKYTYSFLTPCQGPYGTGCAAYTAAALLSQDLANVSGQDVKTAVYHLQLNVTQLTTDEITLSRQWMTSNLTGLPTTPVYVYPGGYETTAMQGITEGVPYQGARGALKEDLGVKDTYADGFNAQNITSFGVNPSWMGVSGVTPALLNQKIQALVWKESVWGVPWGIFWHLNELTNADPVGGTEITNLIQDFKASGATIRTNTGLVNWLLGGTQETGTDGNYYYAVPAMSVFSSGGGLDFRPTRNSPVVNAGQNLGAAYELDINGVNQNGYGSGWEIGAHVYQGYSVYGLNEPGSYFRVGVGATICGPPLYNCSSASTAVVQTPTPPILLTGTTGYNEIAFDTSLNPSGIDPITRLTDSTMLDGYSPSPTPSQGDNDRASNCAQRGVTPGSVYTSAACAAATIYYIIATYGGCPYVEGVQKTSSGLQVVYPLPAHKGAGYAPATCGNYSFAQTDPTITYSVPGSGTPIIYKTVWTPSGGAGSVMAWTQTALYNLQSLCPLPTSFATTWASSTSTDISDTYFTVGLSNAGGQNTGNYMVRLDTNSSPPTCLVYNTGDPAHASTAAPFGTTSCTGANCPPGSFAPTCQFTIHDVFGNDNPTYVALSTGGQTTSATCVTNKPVWQPYSQALIQCSVTGTIGGHVCNGGHYATGYNNISITNNPYLFSFPASEANSGTGLSPFNLVGASYGLNGNCENHFSNSNANGTDTNPVVGATANNNYSTSGTISTWTSPGQNEVYIIFPTTVGPTRTAGTVLRSTHTWTLGPGNGVGCGTSDVGPFDSASNFFAQYAIGDVTQDGSFFWWSSSMLGSLGTDSSGSTAAALFGVRLD
jgi:hypothetical protein